MKKLSIEDKAKRYDEAYNVADNIHKYSSDPAERKRMEEIFLELKESEDERIKQDIITTLSIGVSCKESALHPGAHTTLKEAIAWLEKQGKNNMGISEATKKKLEDNLNKALEKETPESFNEFLDGQGEQKPVDFSDLRTWKYIVDAVWTEKEGIGQYLDSPFTEEVAKKLQKRFGTIEQKPAIKLERDKNGEPILTPFEAELFSMMSDAWQGYQLGEEVNIAEIVKEHSSELLERANEQKPALSEEDESRLDIIFERIERGLIVDKDDIDRLKSLKDRVQPQPKQEWSEEDEQLYNDLSDTYFYNDEDYPEETYKFMLKRVLDWMTKRAKSLRPKSTWKPSDNELEVLRLAAEKDGACLMGLYEQLKKLREE